MLNLSWDTCISLWTSPWTTYTCTFSSSFVNSISEILYLKPKNKMSSVISVSFHICYLAVFISDLFYTLHANIHFTFHNIYRWEKRLLELSNPKIAGEVSHLRIFHKSTLTLSSVRVALPLLKSTVNVNKSSQYDLVSKYVNFSYNTLDI